LKKIIIGYCIDTMPCRVCVFKWVVIPPNGSMLLIDLAKNIDPNHIGNLVLENTNAPISGRKRPSSKCYEILAK
jgi:hypothetical protein